MIGIIFNYLGEQVEFRLGNKNLFVRTSVNGGAIIPFNEKTVKLNREGSMKEHPDLKEDPDWKRKVIERLRTKLYEMKSDKERIDYIIKDLSKIGYVPIGIQRKGHRLEKIKWRL